MGRAASWQASRACSLERPSTRARRLGLMLPSMHSSTLSLSWMCPTCAHAQKGEHTS